MSCIGLSAGIAIFLLPGLAAYCLPRARRTFGLVFLVSSMAVFQAVFLLQIFSLRINFANTAAAMLVFTAALISLGAVLRGRAFFSGMPDRFRLRVSRPAAAAALALLPLFIIFIVRLCRMPLQGWDTFFRWDYLAVKILELGNLDFYPPVRAEDFFIYSYCDGIPPLASSNYFWLYASYGEPLKILTGIFVLAQMVSLLFFTFKTSRLLFGRRAAFFSVVLLAYSPLFFWSVLMGQETGWTALSLISMLHFLLLNRKSAALIEPNLLLAGVAGALGALSREYGCAYLIIGVLFCILRRDRLRSAVRFSAVFLAFAAPWYARNWIVAGNPFYSIASFGGLFYVNPVHAAIMDAYKACFGPLGNPTASAVKTAFVLFSAAPFALFMAVPGFAMRFKRLSLFLAAAAMVFFIWAYSIGMTAGGFFYSMRVLNPALVLSSLAAGAFCIAMLKAGAFPRITIVAAACLLCCAGFLQDFTVPLEIWNRPLGESLKVFVATHRYFPGMSCAQKTFMFIPQGQKTRILGDNSYFHAAFSGGYIEMVPVWSPEVAFLFDESATFEEQLKLLSERGISFLLHSPQLPNKKYLKTIPFFRRALDECKTAVEDADGVIYDLRRTPLSPQ